ncbi:hypothetical protein ACJ41O_010323 [Fusarium nematophilum]
MASEKEQEHLANKAPAADTEPPPAYETGDPGPSSIPPPADPHPPSKQTGPTAESPFNFPSDAPLPSYAEASSSSSKQPPIAIPQANPTATAPFLNAYAPCLLSYGITQQAWSSFLDTLSAFLTAKVSARAISHAGDVAKKVGETPTYAIKNVVTHAKDVGKEIRTDAKKGDIVSAAVGVIGGAISIPITAAMGIVQSAVTLPGHTVAAAVGKPKTPRQRCTAYLAVANKDWFSKRGLHASLATTDELSQVVGSSITAVLEAGKGKGTKLGGAEGQLSALEDHIARLEIQAPDVVDLGAETLWLVVVPVEHLS